MGKRIDVTSLTDDIGSRDTPKMHVVVFCLGVRGEGTGKRKGKG
jgi:hypothetical protein